MARIKNLKNILNELFINSSLYSLEKAFAKMSVLPNIKKEMRYEISLLKKGYPANRILKYISKKNIEYYDIIDFIGSIPNIQNIPKQNLAKIFNSLLEVNQNLLRINNYLSQLKLKVIIMNIMLSLIYSIFPWLILFIEASQTNLFLENIFASHITLFITFYGISIIFSIILMLLIEEPAKAIMKTLTISVIFWLFTYFLYLIIKV